jgi:putative hemolysin
MAYMRKKDELCRLAQDIGKVNVEVEELSKKIRSATTVSDIAQLVTLIEEAKERRSAIEAQFDEVTGQLPGLKMDELRNAKQSRIIKTLMGLLMMMIIMVMNRPTLMYLAQNAYGFCSSAVEDMSIAVDFKKFTQDATETLTSMAQYAYAYCSSAVGYMMRVQEEL